jgi:hypothetical protein
MDESFNFLQSILGTGKSNPVFSVSQHTQTGQFHVYYGLELFEVVPSDREDTRFKLMVAHLSNVGVRLTALHEAFGVDPRTIKKWAGALKTGDAQKLIQALAGRGANRKLTPAVEHFVRQRFAAIYSEDRYTYSRRIRGELKDLLQVNLTGETLRPLLGELKVRFEEAQANVFAEDAAEDDAAEDDDADDDGDDDDEQSERESSRHESLQADSGEQPSQPRESSEGCGGNAQTAHGLDESLDSSQLEKHRAPGNRRESADFTGSRWCSHLGLLLFSQPLLSLAQTLGQTGGAPVCQWLSQVLLGAANLEQSKLISRSDLGLLLGSNLLGGPDHQRRKLDELAQDPGVAQNILRWNFQRLGGETMSDFFYDPHTKQYTGGQNVLKGWCSKIRFADKVMHADFVHSRQGQPLYLENTDNYEDMRQRFAGLESRFRQSLGIGKDRALTWIVDRGIFSLEMYQWVLESPHIHLITWEKGYQRDGWPEGLAAHGSMSVERPRNHSTDLLTYHFEWIVEPWPKETRITRVIVRATNPEGNLVEASILCDDREREIPAIIWPMFDRWLQENDFKYLDIHFGINQITSYQSENYAELREKLEDRKMKNADYAVLESGRRAETKRLGAMLVLHRNSQRKQTAREQSIAELEVETKALNGTEAERQQQRQQQRQQLARLKAGQKSAQLHSAAREVKIRQSEQRIDEWTAQLQTTAREVSRIDTLISRGAVRMRGEKKHLMDVIKLTARNLFYQMLAPFKEAYDNYRDDHVWFRHLSQSGGIIQTRADGTLRCHLIGTADYPKPVRKVITGLLGAFNQNTPCLPDGSERPIQLLTGSKSAIELAPPQRPIHSKSEF